MRNVKFAMSNYRAAAKASALFFSAAMYTWAFLLTPTK